MGLPSRASVEGELWKQGRRIYLLSPPLILNISGRPTVFEEFVNLPQAGLTAIAVAPADWLK